LESPVINSSLLPDAGRTARHQANALALSPDGQLLVTAGRTHELLVLAPATEPFCSAWRFLPIKRRRRRLSHPSFSSQTNGAAQLHRTGVLTQWLAHLPGGRQWGHQSFHCWKRPDSLSSRFARLPPADAPRRAAEIPRIAVSPDGKRLYVALNLSNRLAELDAATGEVLRLWEVGVEPFDVVFADRKVYVSNWATSA